MKPEILAICCNWCAYAGADLAGVSRIEYPANIEVVRVMCSGRVDPRFILSAFANGADGVMVAGCHEADCHYSTGNMYAERRIESIREVMELIGIDSERLVLKWINANEGAVFADTVSDFTKTLEGLGPLGMSKIKKEVATVDFDELVSQTEVVNCLECGKCTASCPVARRDPRFSPRLMIEKALEDLPGEIETDNLLWSCLTCRTCEQRCPSGVRFCEFVIGARAEAMCKGNYGKASKSGFNLQMMRIASSKNLAPKRLNWVKEDMKVKKKASSKSDYLYFVGCAPIYQAIYGEDVGAKPGEIPSDTVSLLNACGIEPVLMEDERCCGHDLLWNGDREGFEALASANIERIKATGAGKIVTACPECYRTLKLDWGEREDFDFEVFHISEVLSENIDKLEMNSFGISAVTLQDPCRLGRHAGVYEEPRRLIDAVSGTELREMERVRQDAICCGVSGWMNCGWCSRLVQTERLKEAKATGAEALISPCLKCSIHLSCALSGELPADKDDVEVKIMDLTDFLARACGLKEAVSSEEKAIVEK